MIRKGILFILVCVLSACAVKPAAITIDERYAEAQADVKALFDPQKNFPRQINYYEALARSLKYNLDYRIKIANFALQAGQLEVAKFTMFPALNVSGSVYTRSNDLSSFGVTSSGAPTDVLNSTPRTLRSARVAMSWNVLDFGLGYVRAREQGQRILIAQEEARKQEQTLAQDVLVAYWDAYNAQQLIAETREFQQLLTRAKNKLSAALKDKMIPQENILDYQSAILEGSRRLIQLSYKYSKAMLDLKHLLNLPPDQQFTLAPPPFGITHQQNIRKLNFAKLDAITLVKRPELRGQEYQKRIAELGIKTAILQALPGITLNEGWNYNSNKFLINSKWVDRSMDVAWNLLNLASLPTTYDAAKLQVKYETLKRMALTVAVLTETRYAYWHYQTLSDEYTVAHKQTLNAEAIYTLNHNRKLASLASDQQVILAKLHVLTSKMDEQLLLSNLSTALGELYLSSGSDLLPVDVDNQSVADLMQIIQERFALDKVRNFNEYIDTTYAEIFAKKVPEIAVVSTKPPVVVVKQPVPEVAMVKQPVLPLVVKSETAHEDIKPPILQDTVKPEMVHEPVKPQVTPQVAPPLITQKTPVVEPMRYTIQLFGSYDSHALARFQKEQHLNQNIYYGLTKHNGHDWYVLTLGQFDTLDAAKTQMKSLHKKHAWVRNANDLHLATTYSAPTPEKS
jgi:multidrug efflux system outer membrane protein